MKPVTGVHRPRIRRWMIAVAVLLVAGAAGWLGLAWYRTPDATTYTTVAVQKATITQSVTAAGTLDPVVQVEVGSQVSGRIKDLKVDFNDHVTKGEVLATIDPSVFESQVDQARSRLTSARADLTRMKAVEANAKAQYQRVQGLKNSGAVATSEIDAALADWRSAQAQITGAQAAITEAQAALEQSRSNLDYTTITSPIDGIVISRNVDVGQTVAASLSAPVLFVIAGGLDQMEVHTSVAESDVGQLTEGMKVSFTVDAYPDRTFTGAVKQVRFAATTVSNVVTYDAVVAVANPDLALRPGMTANATFVIAERDDVLSVPAKALKYRPSTAKRPAPRKGSGEGPPHARGAAVWVLRDDKPIRVQVETGLSDGTTTEITGGDLAEGDLVITADSTAKATSSGSGQQQGRRMPRGAF